MFTPAINLNIFSLSREKGEVLKAFSALSSKNITELNSANAFAASGSDLSQRILQTPRFRLYLPSLLLLFWVCGFIISSLNIITGRIILSKLLKNALPIKADRFTCLVRQLLKSMEIKQNIRLLKSPQCKLPFTCRVLRPVIVLPNDIEGWRISRIRAVLIHELAHIKRRDYFTKHVSRIICSVYWFMPLTWIAYFNFYLEQEEICDSFVVNAGEKSVEYAGQLVDFARIKRKHVMLAGIFISNGRKKMMEKRILNILRTKGPGSLLKLKRRWLKPTICLSLLLFFLVINPAVSEKYEAMYGIWSNEEYNEGDNDRCCVYAKHIYNPDGTYFRYRNSNDKELLYFGKFIIADSWADSEGTIWILENFYQGAYFKGKKVSQYKLIKISNSGNTMEFVWNSSNAHEYPSETGLDPNNTKYHILYRQ
jgi:beta-lactamase regulating signal transducer with metallopeptidase domain